jgi:hypothetical protein
MPEGETTKEDRNQAIHKGNGIELTDTTWMASLAIQVVSARLKMHKTNLMF